MSGFKEILTLKIFKHLTEATQNEIREDAFDNNDIVKFIRALPDGLTFKDLTLQSPNDPEITQIEGWKEIKEKAETEHSKIWAAFKLLSTDALRSSTTERGMGNPGWTLGEFKNMTEDRFEEKPQQGLLSRDGYKILHKLLTKKTNK